MGNNLVESVEFQVKSPKTALPGLDEAHRKLLAIQGALQGVEARLAGLSTNSAFKRSVTGIADAIKQLEKGAGKGSTLKQISQVLGFDPKDVRQYLLREQERITQGIQAAENKRTKLRGAANASARQAMLAEEKRLQSELMSLRKTFEGQQLRSSGAKSSAQFFYGYQKSAVRGAKEPIAALQAMFGGPASGGSSAARGVAASVSGMIPLIIPASQIVASVSGTVVASGASGSGAPGSARATSGGRSITLGPGGQLIESKITETAKSKIVQNKELVKIGETVDQFFKEVNGALTPIKEVTTSSPLKRARVKLQEQVSALKKDLEDELAKPATRRDPAQVASLLNKQAKMMESFVSGRAGKELEDMGQGSLVSRTRAAASKFARRAQEVQERAQAQEDAEQRTLLDQRTRGRNRMLSSRQKSDEKAAKAAADVAALSAAEASAGVRRRVSHAAAQDAINDFLGRGGVIKSDVTSQRIGAKGPSTARTIQAEMDFGGKRETITATFDATGASVKRMNRALSEARAEAGLLGGDFIKNTAKVTTWAASVALLYKTIELANYSFRTMVEIGAQAARLDQVFRKVGGGTSELTKDVLELAAVNGRSTKEAMESAIQWSRLGLTRAQVNEAVRVSLMAANVAELTAAESTEKLQGIMQNYGLSVGQLRSVLGELNQISNTYNVTNADMLEGLSRTAAVAKQAGIPLHELMGLIGATVGATSQTGANIGNAIKSFTLSLSNPVLQKQMRTDFGFEVSRGGSDLKGMSQIIGELFVKYQSLNDAQRQNMLFQIAGKTQASRLAALLDNYVKAQVLAVNAQLNLNSAEQENAKIKAALHAQLVGLSTEWERFVTIQGNRGPVQVLSELSSGLRNVISLMNTKGASLATTGLFGLIAAGGMKSVLTGLSMQGGQGFMGRSAGHVRSALGGLNQTMMVALAQGMGGSVASNVTTRGLTIAGGNRGTMAGQFYLWSEALLRVGRSSVIEPGSANAGNGIGSNDPGLGRGFDCAATMAHPAGGRRRRHLWVQPGDGAIGLSSERAEGPAGRIQCRGGEISGGGERGIGIGEPIQDG
jgi:TP901 family phage tail tape measure protein